ncbi:ribokinase [Lucilia sericata]|uniref:ribokinase n=1 Tax=Lucilia sericata TaxID=13632 RepID=UPI0018A863F2|nr:ribokinase [Lucilia sericata]
MSDKTKNINVLVYGSAIVDFICYVDRLPKAGETLHGHKFANGFGGKGANQCVAAARLGANTAMIAKLGMDMWGEQYVQQLKRENVNVDFVKQCAGESTGIAQIAVSSEGENHIVIVAGANNNLAANDVQEAEALFQNAKVLLCQLETPLVGTLAALQAFKGISILNAAPALKNTPAELLKAASILCVNETEAALMCELEDIQTLSQAKIAAQKLLKLGAQTVIITLGSQGAVYSSTKEPSKCIHVPAHKVEKVLDTTGAGDAFLGALAFHMAQNPQQELHQHIGFANYVAAHSVQYPGTQSSFPKAQDIQTVATQTYNFCEI